EPLNARLAVERTLKLLPREILQPIHAIGSDPELGEELLGRARRVLARRASNRGATHRDRAMHQSFGRRHRHQRRDLAAAARLTERGDVRWIAAKRRDV